MSVKCWVIQFHHKHGVDSWPVFSKEEPDGIEAAMIDDDSLMREEFESEDLWVEVFGPFDIPRS